ncbi:TS1R1 protein, partial [Leiothrix lutea]|nr:TS1R1 protein [Leiothrix lutea]
VQVLSSFQHYEPQAVAVIGPDSTRLALTTAAVLSLFLVPEISYEASTESLSLKRLYPSFLRTIPSDRQQVKAIFSLLQHFGWTWVVLLGSDNPYGRAGLDALQELLTASNVCVAYRGNIPANSDASNPELHNLVRILTEVKVNVTVVFSNKGSVLPFFEVVVQRNITDMVWVASEDWSLAQIIWRVPGIQTIGSVFGMAVEQPESTMLERFEAWKVSEEGAGAECASSAEAGGESAGNAWLDCTQCCTSCRALATVPDMYDAQGSFNVYSAVYAVAHGLHDLLGCASGTCSKGTVYPWQLLQKIRQVNFTLYRSRISFDTNGDIHKGYDIVMWKWRGPNWATDVIGTFRVNPDRLSIDPSKILWHTEDGKAPTSVCSAACDPGEMRLQQSRHKCCFSCVACPAGTFLNKSAVPCTASSAREIQPSGCLCAPGGTQDFRTTWSPAPGIWKCLPPGTGLSSLLPQNHQPQRQNPFLAVSPTHPHPVEWAGAALGTGGAESPHTQYCHIQSSCCRSFPGYCLMHGPLTTHSPHGPEPHTSQASVSAHVSARLNARCPALYEAWMRRQGPVLFVVASTAAEVLVCVVAEAVSPSVPRREYGARDEWVVLECAQSGAADAAIAYTVLLSAGCFALSYAGTDLPAAYNEAKSLTVSLLLHLACSAAVLCSQGALRGRAETAARVLSTLGTLAALLGGYFVPRAFVILLRPHQNTAEYFQMAIQEYTRR